MKNEYEVRGDVTVIIINRRDGSKLETEIDSKHLKRAQDFPNTWTASWYPDVKTFYVCGQFFVGKGKNWSKNGSVSLHRWLLEPPDNMVVDHKDHNGLNNRESTNLRIITKGQNNQNPRGARESNKSSGIRGVTWHKKLGKWMARYQLNGKQEFVGTFDTTEEAGIAVSNARAKYMPFSQEAIIRREVV